MKKIFIFFALIFLSLNLVASEPLRYALGGITHGHSHPILRDLDRTDIELVGIWEPDTEVAYKMAEQYGLDKNMIYSDLGKMLDDTKPEALAGFGTILSHLELVQEAAPRGIHVMVEKPLAISVDHANQIEALAKKHDIIVMTNYETTWYPSHENAYDWAVRDGKVGPIRKMIVYDGHRGPGDPNNPSPFWLWLTDPVYNGAGAVIDFGCYGANLMTWMLKGEKPVKVFADIRTYDTESYPKVDDDATIILSYENTVGVLNPSWTWPFSRKDIHIYGRDGYVFADNDQDMRFRFFEEGKSSTEKQVKVKELAEPYNEAFKYFKAWIRGDITPEPYDLSTLENNVMVVEILEAAMNSAKSSKAIYLK